MMMENIQDRSTKQSIAQGVLLIQETRIRARLHIVPSAPFIHAKRHFFLGIVHIHHFGMTTNQFVHLQTFLHSNHIFFFVEIGGRTFTAGTPTLGHRVIMHRQSPHATRTNILHQSFRPIDITAIRSAGNFHQTIVAIISTIGSISTVLIAVELSRHIAAAAPVFVTHAPEFHRPRLFTTIFLTQISHRRFAIESDVFHPFRHFFHGAATQIAADIRFGSKQFTEVEKFVRTEGIVFHHATPVRIHHFRTTFARTDTIAPMIFIGKTATRPTEIWNLNFFQSSHNIIAIAIGIRNGRLGTHPNATINTMTKMFREMTINMTGNFVFCLISLHYQRCFFGCRKRQCQRHCCQNTNPKLFHNR